MDLKVSIKGLGKISEGEVNLKGFTVFAGRNNTGKTFVSKTIYSALRGTSSNHAWNLIGGEVQELYGLLAPLHPNRQTQPQVLKVLGNLASTPTQFLNFLDKDGNDYAKRVREIAAGIDAVYKTEDREQTIKDLAAAGSKSPELDVEMIEKALDAIKKFTQDSAEEIIEKSVNEKMLKFLMENFRSTPNHLISKTSKECSFNINGCLEVAIKQGQFNGRWNSNSEIVNIPSLFFIDSVGLKLNSQLIRDFSSLKSRYHMIPETSAYHTDLLDTIEAVNLVPEEPLENVISNIAKSIGGKLEYDQGALQFHEEGVGIHDASVTSSGILQLGLLGLVLEKGLLREGSFLFIDEPETNLHPAWQTLVSGLLAELACKGKINIVMATHSPNIIQYLKYGAKHDDDFDSILSVNYFSGKGINLYLDDAMSNYEKLQQIESALNERYMDIFLRGAVSG